MAERTLQAFDTSVIIAALLGWHEHHQPALTVLQRALDEGRVVLPAPALVESYAVMTRMPAPHRIAPSDALSLLEGTFMRDALIGALGSSDLWRFMRELPVVPIAGGRTYDAHILACAVKAKAHVLWTFNDADFEAVGQSAITIKNPSVTK